MEDTNRGPPDVFYFIEWETEAWRCRSVAKHLIHSRVEGGPQAGDCASEPEG